MIIARTRVDGDGTLIISGTKQSSGLRVSRQQKALILIIPTHTYGWGIFVSPEALNVRNSRPMRYLNTHHAQFSAIDCVSEQKENAIHSFHQRLNYLFVDLDK